jgi:hypothetical protein
VFLARTPRTPAPPSSCERARLSLSSCLNMWTHQSEGRAPSPPRHHVEGGGVNEGEAHFPHVLPTPGLIPCLDPCQVVDSHGPALLEWRPLDSPLAPRATVSAADVARHRFLLGRLRRLRISRWLVETRTLGETHGAPAGLTGRGRLTLTLGEPTGRGDCDSRSVRGQQGHRHRHQRSRHLSPKNLPVLGLKWPLSDIS